MALEKIINKSKRSDNIAVDNLIVDDKLKGEIIEFYDREDYNNPRYWVDKKRIMRRYRAQCAEHLVTEYNWNKRIAKKTANIVNIPTKNTSFTDYLTAYAAGSLPKRYAEPIAKLMGKDVSFYTRVNIVADAALLSILTLYITKHLPENITLKENLYDLNIDKLFYSTTNHGLIDCLAKLNIMITAVQIPIRTGATYLFKKHTWSPANLSSPIIVPSVIFLGFLAHNYYRAGAEFGIKFMNTKLINKLSNVYHNSKHYTARNPASS